MIQRHISETESVAGYWYDYITKYFPDREPIVERFRVRSEAHKGRKEFVYDTLFVDLYNPMPNRPICKIGYHRLNIIEK